MSATIVRYRLKPGRAAENAALVRAVYAELAALQPTGFRYATFAEGDGLTVVHIALTADGCSAPLPGLAAFRRFREGLDERCAEPPVATTLATAVGAYRMEP